MKRTSWIVVLAFLFSACSSTYLTNSRSISTEKKSYDKIVVLARSKSQLARAHFEDDLVKSLAARGISAISSLTAGFDIPMEGPIPEDRLLFMENKLKEMGINGAIVTNLVDASQYTDVIPGSPRSVYPVYYGRFRRYYGYYPMTMWEPDQMVTGKKYVLESCLYDLREAQKDNLQWVGMFELKDPGKLSDVSTKYANELTEALLKSNILVQ